MIYHTWASLRAILCFGFKTIFPKGQGNNLQSERGREETDGQVGASATISIISDKDRQRQTKTKKTDKDRQRRRGE